MLIQQRTCVIWKQYPKEGSAYRVKPIFHCDSKPFTLGTFTSPIEKDSTFVLPNARYTNMLVSLALGDANFSRYLT